MQVPTAKVEKFAIPEKDAQGSPMQHLWLDAEGSRLMATNGHMAVRQTVAIDPEDTSGLVPVEAIALARQEMRIIGRFAGKDTLPDTWLRVVCRPDEVWIQNLFTNTTHMVARPKLNDGQKFPLVDVAFPALAKQPTVTLNGEYLAEIVSALSTEGFTLNIWATEPDKAVTIASDSGQALAVVMPMRSAPDAYATGQRGMAGNKPPVSTEGVPTPEPELPLAAEDETEETELTPESCPDSPATGWYSSTARFMWRCSRDPS